VILLKAAVRARESKIVGQGLVVFDMHPENPLAARALSPEVPGIVGGHRDVHRHSAALFTDDLRPIGHSVTDWPGHRRISPMPILEKRWSACRRWHMTGLSLIS
jgi:hypothetical protein